MEIRVIQKSLKIFFKRNMNIKMMVQRCIIKKKKPVQAFQRGFWNTVIGDEA